MKKFYYLTVFVFISVVTNGQPFNFDGLVTGATGSFTNGWVGTPTTGYSWRAKSDSTTSQGTGPRFDHTLGNTSGIYMYVEASSPAAVGNVATLTSSTMSYSGLTNAGLSFWYHMAGSGMGNMYIDIFSGGSWTTNVDSLVGNQQNEPTSPWLNKIIDLSSFTSPIQVRYRGTYGTTWSGDMAIDDVDIVDIPPYDVYLKKVIPSHYYYMMPTSQIQSMTFSGWIENLGVDTVTNVTLNGSINTSPISGSVAQMLPYSEDTIAIATSYLPSTVGFYVGDFNVSITETDTVTYNDSLQYNFEISDSVMAREDGSASLGIGFNGLGEIGQLFEVYNADSLSSVSFKLVGPTVNQTLRVKVYNWNGATNTVGSIIDSSKVFTIPSTASAWYTVQLTCDRVLTPGMYLFAVEQLTTTNMSLAYTAENYEDQTSFFSTTGVWNDLGLGGFPVALGIRANFGAATFPTVSIGSDTGFCAGSSININAPAGYTNYLWSNGGVNASNVISSPDSTFWVQVTNSRGCKLRDTIIVEEYPNPDINLPSNVGICDGQIAVLVANNDPNYSYLWNTGSVDSSISVSVSGFYAVTVTNTFGCDSIGFTSVIAGATPVADIGADTIRYCEGTTTVATASGSGNAYSWSNGEIGQTATISQPGQIILTVTSPAGCIAYDTAFVVEQPELILTISDTLVNICEDSTLVITGWCGTGGVTDYLWSDGSTNNTISVNSAGTYYLTVTNGVCSGTLSTLVNVDPLPDVDLGNDTTICPGQVVVLDAGGNTGDSYSWSTGANTQTISVNTANDYFVTLTDGNTGCNGKDSITVTLDVCDNIEELEAQFTIYPNPASEILNIELTNPSSSTQIEIYDMKGALVMQLDRSGSKISINVSNLPKGMYQLRIFSNNHSSELPFLKQ